MGDAGPQDVRCALLWIPYKDPKAELGNRIYAETTKMELPENLARGKKVILGIDSEICGTRHMKFLAKRYGVKVHTSMEGCLAELTEWMNLLNGETHIEDSDAEGIRLTICSYNSWYKGA